MEDQSHTKYHNLNGETNPALTWFSFAVILAPQIIFYLIFHKSTYERISSAILAHILSQNATLSTTIIFSLALQSLEMRPLWFTLSDKKSKCSWDALLLALSYYPWRLSQTNPPVP